MITILQACRVLSVSSLLLAGCTHYYYPMNDNASLQDRNDLSDYKLEGAQIDLRCTWRSAHGSKEAAPNLCGYLNKLLSRENAEIGSSSDDNAEASKIDLRVFVDGRAMATQSSTLDQTLMWITLGLYPAVTDRWHAIDVQIYDDHDRLLEKGSFKALFRTYYGWGYWLGDRAMSLVRSNPPHRYKEPNSEDFYHFISQMVYNARMGQLAQSSPHGKGE